MSDLISKRSEIIFCYDIKDANPNGDPLDNNKPRIDEETGVNLVTDVRFKRTSRDYLYNYLGHNPENDKDIFVRETFDYEKKGTIKDGKLRAKDFKEDANEILKKCIDIRLFGGVIPLDKGSITYTGPIQFQMGRSMHRVNVQFIKGTGAFASDKGKQQATFREEYFVSYSFINFHGIINENAAKKTGLTNQDIKEFIQSIWEGTKNLISRSKFGQMPRLLLKVNYKDSGFYIGDLDKSLKLVTKLNDEEIRDIEDFSIDLTALKDILEKYNDKIDSIDYLVDYRLKFSYKDNNIKIEDLLLDKMNEIKY